MSAAAGAIAAWCARQAEETHVDRCLRVLCAALVLWFPAACLVINRSDSATLLLLGGIGLYVWIRNGLRSGLARSDWLFVAVFAGFFLSGVLAFELGHQTDEGFRLLGRYLRFLFVLPVLLALRRYPPPAPVLWGSLGLAALLLGLDAIWESVAAHGFLRPDGDTNVAILFGDLAALTTFAFAAGYLYVDARLQRTGPWLVAGCVLMGLLASFLSGTRGAWLAMPVLLTLFLSCRHLLRPRTVLLGGVSIATLFATLVYLPATHIFQRIEFIDTQIEAYWTMSQQMEQQGQHFQCLSNRGALEVWTQLGIAQMPPGAGLTIVRLPADDSTVLASQGCLHGSAIYMQNHGKQVAWIALLRYQPQSQRATGTHFIVKGTGHVGYAGPNNVDQFFEVQHFTSMLMRAPAATGERLVLTALPGDEFWFMPEEAYVGEYSYMIFNTPVGQRLEMWWASLQLFKAAPVFGVGLGAYQAETAKLVTAGLAAPGSAEYDHPHSDFFDALANRGLVGFLALLSLFAVPAWLYARRLDSHDPHALGAALGGLLVTVGYAIFGLTETLFIHSVTIGWYVIMTAVFLVCSAAPEGKGKDR